LTIVYGYDDPGNLKPVSQLNGVTTTYTYDDLNRLTLEEVKDSGNNLIASYTYD